MKVKKPYTCDLCGKTDNNVQMYCGGYSAFHHPECGIIGNKAIEKYLNRIAHSPRSLEFLVNTFHKIYHDPNDKEDT